MLSDWDLEKAASSLLNPMVEFLLEMGLQLGEFIAEILRAAPTLVALLEISILIAGLAPDVVFGKWEVLERDKEIGIEAVVMLLMLESVRVHVSADDVYMQVVH